VSGALRRSRRETDHSMKLVGEELYSACVAFLTGGDGRFAACRDWYFMNEKNNLGGDFGA